MDTWRAVMRMLINHPLDLIRLSRTCKSLHQTGQMLIKDGLIQNSKVSICHYDEHNRPQIIYIRPYTNDIAKALDYHGYKCCEIIWGNMMIIIRRYQTGIATHIYVNYKRIFWEWILDGIPLTQENCISFLKFIDPIMPGVFPSGLL